MIPMSGALPALCEHQTGQQSVEEKLYRVRFGQHAAFGVIPFTPVDGATLGRDEV